MAASGSAVARWRPRSLGAIRAASPGVIVGIAVAALASVACGALVARGMGQLALAIALGIPAAAVVLRYPFAGILIWLIAMPFAGLTSPGAEAGPIIWGVHRLGVPILIVLSLVGRVLGPRRPRFRLGAIDAAIGLFLILGVTSTLLFAPIQGRELAAFMDKLAIPIAFFWLIRLLAPERADLRRLLPIAVGMILLQTTIGALSWLAPSVLPAAFLGRVGERAVGTLGGPAPYTITLVFFSLLLVFWASEARGAAQRGLLIAIVGIGVGGVVVSLSRGSWLGASVAFGGLVFMYPRLAPRLAAVGVIVIALIGLGPLGGVLSRVSERVDDAATVDARLITNDAAFRMVADRPLLGFGFNNFEAFDEGYKQRVGDIPLNLGGSNHNSYLGLTVELGVPAALAYLVPPVALLVLTIRLRRALRDQPARGALVVILWLAIADQFLVSNFADMVHSSLWATSIWWMTLGLIAFELDRARALVERPIQAVSARDRLRSADAGSPTL